MPPLPALILSALIFLIINGLLRIPLMNPGDVLENGWELVDSGRTEEAAIPWNMDLLDRHTVVLRRLLPPTAGESLVITGLNTTGLTATVDGKTVRRIGDHEHATANIWNAMVVVPLDDSGRDDRLLELKISGHQVLGLYRIPFVEESGRAQRRLSVHRVFYNSMVVFFMGASVMIGALLIGFSLLRRPRRLDGLLLGLSGLFIAFYATDYTFRYSMGVFPLYTALKRIVIALGYLGSFSFLAGLDFQANSRFTWSKVTAIPTLAGILMIAVTPTVGVMNRLLPWFNIVLLANLVLVIIVVARKMRKRILYVIASGLIFLAILQMIAIMTIIQFAPAVLQYIVVIASALIGMQFLLDYREVYHDREKLRRVYNRDELTGAYNRRALNSVALAGFSTAVFLDFDLFKSYNDSYGHDRGDSLLKDFVRVANGHVRRDDLVIRYGGDEFLILLGDADREEAAAIIERIRSAFLALEPGGGVDVSYGIESVSEDGEIDIVSLDERMYAMKLAKRRS